MELIRITEENGRKVVSAKDLYNLLGYERRHWARWASKNLVTNSYAIEGVDYTTFTTMVNGNETSEFAVTVEFAEKLAMMAKTEKGEQVRAYFISCRDKLRDLSKPKSRLELARENVALIEELEAKDQLLIEQAPKVKFFDAVADSKDAIDIGEAAKVLNIGIGRNRLFELLRNKKILMEKNQPYQKYIDSGWFRVVEQSYQKPDGSTHISIKTLVYNKGLQEILKLAM